LKLFGFSFERIPQTYATDPIANAALSFVERNTEETAAVISASASYGTYVDLQGVIKTEAELITKYRDMVVQPEVDNAVDEIVNESVCTDEEFVIKIDLDDLPLDENAKEVIVNEFHEIMKLLDFNFHAYNIFKRWYVDGRLYYDVVIDNKHPEEGIKELRYVDPRKIREIKEVQATKLGNNDYIQNSVDVTTIKNEYFLYNEKGFGGTNKTSPSLQGTGAGGIRIAKDKIIHVPSGLTDVNGTMGLGYLHKGIKILNQLRTIEDSLIIYRLARAPERRVWYVDVGELPKAKAEQYVRDVMISQKNRLIYDADTGNVRDDRKFMTMLEDYWIPRRADGSGTKVETLQGGKTLGEIEDILYFQKQLYNCLNVPIARINPDAPFMLGRTNEVSRDEIKFDKFISRLRQQFSLLFTKALEKQIVLKGFMTIEEWQSYEKNIKYEFARDNHFAELKDQEILAARVNTAMAIQPFVGMYFSHHQVRREIFKQTNEDIEKITQEIAEEMSDPLYRIAQQQQQGGGGGEEDQQQEDDSGGGGEEESSKNGHAEEEKLDKAQHIIKALSDIKGKTSKEVDQLRAAAKVVAKSK
jgi:hypothetical protein